MKFDSAEQLNQSLMSDISSNLEQTLQQQNQACLLVSGGSTPHDLYQSLSHHSMPWNKISIAMVDERWVNADHTKSNQSFIQQSLIQDKAAKANFFPMVDASRSVRQQDLQDAAVQINQTYSKLPKKPICILGMGADGHTASFFPHAKGLDYALSSTNTYCCAIEANQSETTGELTQRLSITLDYLLSSQMIHLLIKGQQKWDIYQQALSCEDTYSMPVCAVIKQTKTPVKIYWCP